MSKTFKHFTLRQFRSKYRRFEMRLFPVNPSSLPYTKEEEKCICMEADKWIVVRYLIIDRKKLAVIIREKYEDEFIDEEMPRE